MADICSFVGKTLVFTIIVGFIHCNGEAAAIKVKRGANMGLIPFPRVGRSGAYARVPANAMDVDTSEFLHEMKRQNLMAFPRVGRADPWRSAVADNGARNGLWWGPRLGRVQKRGIDLTDAPWALISLREFHMPNTRDTDFTPRLGRESEEDLDEGDALLANADDVAIASRPLDRPLQQSK